MVTSYIKDADKCIFTHIHPRACWYVSYAPRVSLGLLHSPGKRFISTNSRSISRDHYRVTNFLAKMTFILYNSVNLSIFTPNNTSIW